MGSQGTEAGGRETCDLVFSISRTKMEEQAEALMDAPVRWMLVQLGELPVNWVDVHVVVLLKVLRQQLD